MTEEEKENWEACLSRMGQEGFHYCFTHYSHFKEIRDDRFHELRIEYLEAAKKLKQYVEDINKSFE